MSSIVTSWWLLSAHLLLLDSVVGEEVVIARSQTTDCGLEYFNTIEMKCSPCSVMESYAETSSMINHRGCRCPVGMEELDLSALCLDDGECRGVQCVQCNETSYFDSSHGCLKCGSSTVSGTGDCGCSGDASRLIEKAMDGSLMPAKECIACAPGRFVVKTADTYLAGGTYQKDLYECAQCPDQNMVYSSGSCLCKDGYTLVGVPSLGLQSCVEENAVAETLALYPTSAAAAITFDDVLGSGSKVSFHSLVFEHLWANASTRCRFHDGTPVADAACQTLANLCVLTQYDLGSQACTLYTDLQRIRPQRHTWGAVDDLPWLLYTNVQEIRSDSELLTQLDFTNRGGSTRRKLELRIASYTLNGTFLGIEPLGTQLFYCITRAPKTSSGGGSAYSTQWQQFGWSFSDGFECDLNLMSSDLIFYELYILDTGGCTGIGECLYPIPVLNKALKDTEGTRVNQGKSSSADIFVRRFTLVDTQTPMSDTALTPNLIRYVSRLILKVRGDTGNPSEIRTPYLELSYKQVDTFRRDTVRIDFTVEYSERPPRFRRLVRGFAGFCTALTLFVFIWSLRRLRFDAFGPEGRPLNPQDMGFLEPALLIRVLALFSRIFVRIFFSALFCFCSYWFVFFKLEETALILLPPFVHSGYAVYYKPVKAIIFILWCLQLFACLELCWHQSRQDVYLIDWEAPRIYESKMVEHVFSGDAENTSPKKKSKKKDINLLKAPVSSWRSFLVANQWLEMLTMRSTSIHFNLIWLGFFFVYLGMEHDSSSQPKLDEHPDGISMNLYLRVANDVWWWIMLSVVQLVFNWGLYDRFISESKSQRLLDLCAVAKISIFVQDSNFHAYYLHGDSNYDRADDTMARLASALIEKAGCKATFAVNYPEVQCFECFYSPPFKQAFDGVRAPLKSSKKRRRINFNRNANNDNDPLLAEDDSERKKVLNVLSHLDQCQSFIKHFLNHQYQEPYSIDWDSIDPPLFDRFIGAVPEMPQNGSNCLFTTDRIWLFGLNHSFLQATFLGHDLDLLLLEVLTFLVADVLFLNASIAIFLTFLLHHGLRLFRIKILGAGGFLDDHMLLLGRLAAAS